MKMKSAEWYEKEKLMFAQGLLITEDIATLWLNEVGAKGRSRSQSCDARRELFGSEPEVTTPRVEGRRSSKRIVTDHRHLNNRARSSSSATFTPRDKAAVYPDDCEMFRRSFTRS